MLDNGDLADQMFATTEPNANHWLFTSSDALCRFCKASCNTQWAIWSARSKASHNGILQSPHVAHAFIGRFIGELEVLKEKTQVNTHLGPRGGPNPKFQWGPK